MTSLSRLLSHRGAPLGAALVVFSSLFYASYGIWVKLIGDFLGGYTASAARSVVVLVILVPLALVYRRLGAWEVRRNWPYLVGMVLASTLVWGPLYYAILHAGVGLSLAVNYAAIVIGMFGFGRLIAGERFTRAKQLATALGLVGLWLVFLPSFRGIEWLALGGAAISGLAIAFNMLLAKKVPYNATQATVWLWVASVIANVPMAWLLHEPLPTWGLHVEWLWLVVFGVASVIASWAFVAGSRLIDAGTAGVLGLLEIVFGVLIGVALFGERPGLIVLAGVVIILAAAATPYLRWKKRVVIKAS